MGMNQRWGREVREPGGPAHVLVSGFGHRVGQHTLREVAAAFGWTFQEAAGLQVGLGAAGSCS